MEKVWILRCFEGGEAGGVAGTCVGMGPGEHTGRCLLGTAPELDVFKLSFGVKGGEIEACRKGGGRATAVAIAAAVCTVHE